MKIAVIGAEKQEVELLFESLTVSNDSVIVTHRAGLEFHEGNLSGCPVVVVCCGIGKVHAALCAQILISEFKAQAVINTGSAGGLSETLAVLDMVVATDTVQHDVNVIAFGYPPGQIPGTDSPFFQTDDRLRFFAIQAFERISSLPGAEEGSILQGRIASGDAFVTDPDLRTSIVSSFNPVCVEMEGAAIAQVCVVNRIPCAILRSISDLAGHEAGISYTEFSRRASLRSAQVVMEMLKDAAKEYTQ